MSGNHYIPGVSNDRVMSLSALTAAALAVAACTQAAQSELPPPKVSPELYEFANMRPANIIPKSSPAAFVRTFENYCLDGGASASVIARKLRAADYVAVPGKPAPGQTGFVVDDTRPMVVVSDDGRFCAVAAVSRTGQTARVQKRIAQRFPNAQPVAHDLPGVEMLVQTGGKNTGLVVLKRLATGVAGSRLVLAFHRAS